MPLIQQCQRSIIPSHNIVLSQYHKEGGAYAPFSFLAMLFRSVISALLFCILALAAACYLPGLTGHFIFDDAANIRMNAELRIENLDSSSLRQAAIAGDAGLFKRPISTISFALNYYAFGMDAYYFKLVNLVIHLVNGLLVYLFARLLLRLYSQIRQIEAQENSNAWVALAVAGLWLLHPFNLTGVLYVVQRMTSLAAFFTLGGLVLYLHGRKILLAGNKRGFVAIVTALFVATPLAMLCKENGVLLPLLIFTTEATLLRWHTSDQRTHRLLIGLVGLSAFIPVSLGIFYVLNHPGFILEGYAVRDFSLSERLMTEVRVLWFYLRMIVLPSMTEMGLYHDDILISKNLLSPWTTAPAIVGLMLLVVGAFALRNKQPMIAFGITFFLIGHSLESSIIPLEIAFEHRNYLPMIGILLPLAYYSLNSRLYVPSLHLRQVSLFVVIIFFAVITAFRAQQWGDTFMMRLLEVERHPNSVRANTDMAALYDHIPAASQKEAIDLYNKAVFYYQRAADVAPTNLAGLLGVLVVGAERRLPADEALLEALEHRLMTVPFGPPNKNTLVGFARCISEGNCAVDSKIITRLHRATLSNPTLTGGMRDQIVFEFDQLPAQIWSRAE
jgi:hypothetical protein